MPQQDTRDERETVKKPFFEVFGRTPNDEYLYPKKKTQIGGVTLDAGYYMSKGVTISGINFFDKEIWGKNLAVREQNGIIDILGYYKEQ
jgi:hypothetical protein